MSANNLKILAISLLLCINIFSCTKKPTAPIILSKQTLDEKFEANLQKLWSEYFSENFLDSEPITVFVATNRRLKATDFSCEEDASSSLRGSSTMFGACKIIVPKNHRVGEIIAATKEKESLDDVFKIVKEQPLQEQELVSMIQNTNRTPLVFVHGFNVNYNEALLRAAQIAYDLKYQGPIILFTWPAGAMQGSVDSIMLNKVYDKNLYQAKKSINDFKNFISLMQKNEIKVNLLVHSMGHQIALRALDDLAKDEASKALVTDNAQNKTKLFVNKLILNAPDFNNKELRLMLPNIKAISNQITLYCSSNDKAIIASQIINNNSDIGCLYSPELDTIDVGRIDNSLISLGHGYYSSREILTDVSQTLFGLNVKQRIFMSKRRVIGNENKYFLRP